MENRIYRAFRLAETTADAGFCDEVSLRRRVQIAEAQSLHPVRARLAGYLCELSQGSEGFYLPQTNDEIASQLGTVREVVSRTLSNLKASHVIALQGRQVTVIDQEELRRVAGTMHPDS